MDARQKLVAARRFIKERAEIDRAEKEKWTIRAQLAKMSVEEIKERQRSVVERRDLARLLAAERRFGSAAEELLLLNR